MRKLLSLTIALAILTGCRGGLGTAPDISVESLKETGKRLSLKDLRGKVVLLDFWATWCGPCREVMPDIQQLYDKYHEKGLEVLAISDEERSVVEQFESRSGYTYPHFLDTTGEANSAFHVDTIPRTVLIARDGTILFNDHPLEQNGALQALIEKALEER
jgi:thiol-disulfide isomerase/thioredoxin